MNDASAFVADVITQRKRTAEVLPAWGLKAIYAQPRSKVPIDKITDAALLKVKPDDWAAQELPYNLLGIMPRDMVDFDLDIRVKDEPSSRAPQWSGADILFADTTILQPFRDAFKETLEHFDFRAMFGRNTLGGQGHLLVKIAASEERTIEETRTRLKQLSFSLNLGHFQVKLEVRLPPRKKDGSTFVFLPGSIYPDDDFCRFHSMPKGPTSIVNNVLQPYPLELIIKAAYRAALTIACRPMLGEGSRHDTALLISGVLRREVEQTERDGGDFTRHDAEQIFRGIFSGDPELRDRMHVFEQDFSRSDVSAMPGYPALGERIGEDAANALRLMLSGRDTSMLDKMRANIVFVQNAGQCIDLSQRTASGTLALCEHAHMRSNYATQTFKTGKKAVPIFEHLRLSKGRREVDDVVAIPGCLRGELLYQARRSGQLIFDRQSDDDVLLINVSDGWATPYDPDDKTLPRAEAHRKLEEMCSWLSPRPEDWTKLFQMWAFKVQNPLVKPQFALGCYGGQGIGKSFVLATMPQRILGMSVKETAAEDLFGKDFALNAVIGASFLIVNEASDLLNYGLVKSLARSEHHEINVKFQGKGQHRVLTIPIYVTNDPHPRFNAQGETDRTLYVIRSPTQTSLKLSREDYQTFKERRGEEVMRMVEWLDEPRNCEAIMAVLMEYPVTQQELENIRASDSLTGDYIADDLSPEQLALRTMLEQNVANPQAKQPSDRRVLSAPFDKAAFDIGFNYFYQQYAGRQAKPLSGIRISKILKECLGEVGELQVGKPHEGKRVYWFPVKLGSLCSAFDITVGGVIPRETPIHQELGDYAPDVAAIRNSVASWSRVDTTSNF
jgi:hypothetical protein